MNYLFDVSHVLISAFISYLRETCFLLLMVVISVQGSGDFVNRMQPKTFVRR